MVNLFVFLILLSSNFICIGSPRPNVLIIMSDDMGYSDSRVLSAERSAPRTWIPWLSQRGCSLHKFLQRKYVLGVAGVHAHRQCITELP